MVVEDWQMALNLGVPVALVLLLVASLAATQLAAANFADAAGFSGRAGATCLACHTPAPDPASGLEPTAQAILDGLPATWDLGRSYNLTVRVTGGPPAMPAPQPQGGFDLSFGGGTLALPPGTESLLRVVGDTQQEITYRPAGTLQREWQVTWTAPNLADLSAPPPAVPVWLAVLAANGNHVIATNTSDGGERLDASASLQATLPASEAAQAAWQALPLLQPSAGITLAGDRVMVEGRHGDGNATRLLWSLDGQPWQARDTAPAWRLELPNDAGEHVLLLRSEGAGRTSQDVTFAFGEPTLGDVLRNPGKSTPTPLSLPVLALAVALILRRSNP